MKFCCMQPVSCMRPFSQFGLACVRGARIRPRIDALMTTRGAS
ncbi:hypothetical protein [Lysobacter gummosus]